jgi:hypothetical protein
LVFEFKFEFWIESNWQKPIQPIRPSGPVQPTRAWLSRPARVWVGQTDPAQLLSPSSLAPVDPLATGSRCRRLAIPADSGDYRRRHLGQITRLHLLFQRLQLEIAESSSPRRSGWCFPSGSVIAIRLRSGASSSFLHCACCATLRGPLCVCTPVEASFVVLPAVLR